MLITRAKHSEWGEFIILLTKERSTRANLVQAEPRMSAFHTKRLFKHQHVSAACICKDRRGEKLAENANISYKVFANTYIRLQFYAEEVIDQYQAKSRSDRSTTNLIFAIRHILENKDLPQHDYLAT